jgi:putative redox protein
MDEKIFFKNSFGNTLCGALTTPKENTKYCVVLGHGFTANKDRPRFVSATNLFSKNDFAVFRFDFTGSGESANIPLDMGTHVDDLSSALKLVREKGFTKIFLVCESMCGCIAPQVKNGLYDELIFWVPRLIPGLPRTITEEMIREVNANGKSILKKGGEEFIITKKYIDDLNLNTTQKLVANIKKPLLLIEGSKDFFLEDNKRIFPLLPKGSELVVIEGMEHQYKEHTKELLELTLQQLKKLRN